MNNQGLGPNGCLFITCLLKCLIKARFPYKNKSLSSVSAILLAKLRGFSEALLQAFHLDASPAITLSFGTIPLGIFSDTDSGWPRPSQTPSLLPENPLRLPAGRGLAATRIPAGAVAAASARGLQVRQFQLNRFPGPKGTPHHNQVSNLLTMLLTSMEPFSLHIPTELVGPEGYVYTYLDPYRAGVLNQDSLHYAHHSNFSRGLLPGFDALL